MSKGMTFHKTMDTACAEPKTPSDKVFDKLWAIWNSSWMENGEEVFLWTFETKFQEKPPVLPALCPSPFGPLGQAFLRPPPPNYLCQEHQFPQAWKILLLALSVQPLISSWPKLPLWSNLSLGFEGTTHFKLSLCIAGLFISIFSAACPSTSSPPNARLPQSQPLALYSLSTRYQRNLLLCWILTNHMSTHRFLTPHLAQGCPLKCPLQILIGISNKHVNLSMSKT